MVGHMSVVISRHSGNLELRSLAIQGSQSWGTRFSTLLKLQFRGKLEPVQVSHTRSATVQISFRTSYSSPSPQLTVILKPEDIIDAQPIAWQVIHVIFELSLSFNN